MKTTTLFFRQHNEAERMNRGVILMYGSKWKCVSVDHNPDLTIHPWGAVLIEIPDDKVIDRQFNLADVLLSILRRFKPALILLFLLALPFAARAQSPTNIQIRVTWDGTNSTVNLDSTGSKKDTNRIAGIVYAYGVYTNSLGTNAPLAPGVWLRDKFLVLVDDYSAQKQAVNNAAMAVKINTLLTTQSDLLSTAQLNQLAAIAALLP